MGQSCNFKHRFHMKCRIRISSGKRHRRSGLAPVEMVLLTPFLVFLGALMVNFGDAASWKIKSHSNSHYAATQSQAFRQSSYVYDRARNPLPASWPDPARLSYGGGPTISQLDSQYWNQALQEYSEALMGNPLQDPYPQVDGWSKDVPPPLSGNFTNVDRRMFAERGAHRGTAHRRKRFPIAAILNQSEFNVNHSMEFLSGDWNFGDIGPSWNSDRRVDELYDVEPDELSYLGGLLQGLQNVHQQGLRNDFTNNQSLMVPDNLSGGTQHAYDVMDNDTEFRYYSRGGSPPNFHRHPSGCELEWIDYGYLPAMRGQPPSTEFERYLRRIHLIPRSLGRAWIGLYNNEIDRQKPRPPNYPGAPPYPRGKHWTELEQEVQKLQQYLSNLQGLGY